MLAKFSARALPRGRRNTLVAIGVAFAAFTSFAAAHDGATGVVKDRMDLMKGSQKDMKLLGEMAKGKMRFDAAKAAAAARDLGNHGKKIPDLFPEGSSGHPSEALDAVWQERERFADEAKGLETAAAALAASLDGAGDEGSKAALQKVTDACKSCHEHFRSKEEMDHGHH